MQRAKHWEPGHVTQDPKAGSLYTIHTTAYGYWAGWLAEASLNNANGGGYPEVQIDYIEPAKGASDGHQLGYWAGLGGYLTGNLIQAGTEDYQNTTARHTFFYENPYPGNPNNLPNEVSTPSVASGNEIYVDVSYTTQAAYFMENVTTGVFHTYYQTTSHTDFSTAEAQFEDVTWRLYGVSGMYNQWNVNNTYISDYAMGYELNTLTTLDRIRMGYANTQVYYMGPIAVGTSGSFHDCMTC
jgi:hypothetical protein